MKVAHNTGIDPLYWGKKKQSEFVQYFKGKANKDKLIEIYKDCVKQVKESGKTEE